MGNKVSNKAGSTKNNLQNDAIDLGKLLWRLIDCRRLIISVMAIFALLGIAYALLATPVYKADMLLQVEQKSSGLAALAGDMGDMLSGKPSAATEIALIKSRMLLEKTVDKFNLTTQLQANYLPLIGKGLARLQGKQPIVEVSRFEPPAHIDSTSFTLVIEDNEADRYSLYDSGKRKLFSGIAGELAEQNGYRLFVRRIAAAAGTELSLSKRSKSDAIEWLQKSLSVSERGHNSGILSLSFSGEDKQKTEEILNTVGQNYFLRNVQRNSAQAEKSLELLQKHLPVIKVKLASAEETLNSFRQENDSIDLGLEAQATLKVLVELEAQLNELTFKESEIRQRFSKDHPAYKALLDKRQLLLSEKERLNRQVQAMPETQRQVLRMTRDVEVNQQIYLQLLNKAQELSVLKAANVRVLEKAQSYPTPIKPLIVVLLTLFGGMLAVAFLLLREAFYKGVENPDEIEALGLPVYACIPKSEWQMGLDSKLNRDKHKKNFALQETLLAEANPADLSIEALRSLRTRLHFAMLEAKNNVLMIAGLTPGVGKSFIALNFAAVVAKTGQKVLLVDADMRKGNRQRDFGLQCKNGLSEFLSGKLQIKAVAGKSGVENLDMIRHGKIPPNPSQLLTHPRFAEFVEWASREYDLVLIDSPPALALTDSNIVGALAGTTLMVGCSGKSTLKEIEIAKQRLAMAGIEVSGFILNGFEKKAGSS